MKKHFILSRPKPKPFRARMSCGRSSIPLIVIQETLSFSPRSFIFIMVLFLLAFVSSYCFAADPIDKPYHKDHHQNKKDGEELELSGKVENGIRIIEVKASRYKFEPDPIVVRLGEKVRLIVTSIDVAHGIAISELKINLSVPAGKTEHIEFVADKQGEFHAYCNVYCGPGHGQMHASFIVKYDLSPDKGKPK